MSTDPPPVVLCISGHDPVGGAGVQADIEAVTANGCYACSAITCITVQDSCNVKTLHSQSPDQVLSQLQAVLDDIPVAVIKIGLLGNAGVAAGIAEVLDDMTPRPVIMDPVLAAGGGMPLADASLLDAIRRRLLPLVTLLTPNSGEARILAEKAGDLDECAKRLLDLGCGQILITGTHEVGPRVVNRLYTPGNRFHRFEWERLPGTYHGSGCTLASAIAARLALATVAGADLESIAGLSEPLLAAVREGQAFTWQTLNRGLRIARCQHLPDRMYRLRDLPFDL